MTAIVILNGDPIDPDVREEIPDDVTVTVAADGGLDLALAAGIVPDAVVGDLDSASPTALSRHPGLDVRRFSPDKDRTDLELALAYVRERGASGVYVVGGHGGRLDHLLANAAILASPAQADLDIVWLAGPARVTIVRDAVRLHGDPGETVTLLAYERATGVTTRGLRWELEDAILEAGSGRGVSNVFTLPIAHVAVRQGALVAVQPFSRRPPD